MILRSLAKSVVLGALLSAASLGCSSSRGNGNGSLDRQKALFGASNPPRIIDARCPIRFFRTCEFGVPYEASAALHAASGLVADCGRFYDLATGDYLGVIAASGRLLALMPESQVLVAPLDGGLRVDRFSGAVVAEDAGGSIEAWALSPDRSRIATIEVREPEAAEGSDSIVPAPETPLSAQMEAELVVRRLPSLERITSWPLRRGTLASVELGVTFVDDQHVAYLEEPNRVTKRAVASGAVEHWTIPDGTVRVLLPGAPRGLLLQDDQRRLHLFRLWPPELVSGASLDHHEPIVHSAISGSFEWALTTTESIVHVYQRVPLRLELTATLSAMESYAPPVVDGGCAAIPVEDGVLVSGLGDWPLHGNERTELALSLPQAPGPLFVPIDTKPRSHGVRARYRAADDERVELFIEALPPGLLARRMSESGQSWVQAAVEYAARAEPSPWLAPERLHVASVASEGNRAVEFRLDLRPGETCANDQRYLRVHQTAQALLVLQLNVPLGTEPERVQQLLEAGFDEPLGSPPSARKLPLEPDQLPPCP